VYIDSVKIPDFTNYDTLITVLQDLYGRKKTACVIANSSEMMQIAKSHTCTTLKYTIIFLTDSWCELLLKGSRNGADKLDLYYIEQLPCPVGFTKIKGACQCYPFLDKFHIKCDINHQTLLRPANAWIKPKAQNNSYSYYITLHCPFHYCLPHSSDLNYTTPNSQCQFNRSGILCGHCQQGLSTVFGSSHCQQCSNIYLFLIVPIGIAGLVLVFLLFFLNLTVTDGTINAFILYVNIISINIPMVFPENFASSPAYTFISVANLDLGIQTCFYNGMDDYAKMWLQLAFPFYLISIASLLIIASHYSTKIQRLTASRGIPVLATLFLLSYTKVLLVVSNVLFHYSKIIHLPSKHTSLVWSIDANVSLFGVRFTVLFIACLVVLLILLPFNIVLLFTRTFSRYKFVKKIRPFLDAYQVCYKMKFYYWTGVQLLIRVVFYGISSLDKNINLVISIMVLSIIGVLQWGLKPFNASYKNYHELLFTFNLQLLFVSLLYDQYTLITINAIILLAAAHFTFIILHHIISYTCGGVVRHKIEIILAELREHFNILFSRQHVHSFENQSDVSYIDETNELEEQVAFIASSD